MIEGALVTRRRALGLALVDELIQSALVLGLSKRSHAATVAHGSQNVA